MVNDLVRRADVIEALKDAVTELGGSDIGDDDFEMGVHEDDIESVINSIPSAQ